MSKKIPPTRLIYADSESDSNLYYATQFLVPDPVFYLEHYGKKTLFLSDLELDRGKKEALVNKVVSLSALEKQFSKATGKKPKLVELMALYLKKLRVRKLLLPQTFPAALAFALKKRSFKIEFGPDPFYESRMLKTDFEKKSIARAQTLTGLAIQEAYKVLRASKIRGNRIYYQGKPLTSERLKDVIQIYLLENGCLAQNTIVACGNQGVDPHCRGSGLIYPNLPIIFDVFPRHIQSRYHGDMTRTVVKGHASEKLKKQWYAVCHAQEKAITQVKAGMDGKKIHDGIMQNFEAQGFKTGKLKGRMQGFFHSTGHGIGLDIHEPPRVSPKSHILREAEVVTIEPGLYYHGIGGVRIEDIVYVKKNGREVLGACPKILEIP